MRTAFALTAVILVVELLGGIISHSLALLSDAGHVLTDIFALGLAWFATVQAERPADANKTYGYHRIGILAALANAATLIVIVLAIAYEAVARFQHPQKVTPWILVVSASVGIVVNLYIGFGFRKESTHNLNIRAAMLHVFGDVAASAGVIVGAIVLVLTRWYPVDTVISLGIAALIAWGAWSLLRETVDILMESTPKGLNVAQLVRDMVREPEVQDVHDLHVWSIAGGMRALSVHVQVADQPLSSCDSILGTLSTLLDRKYGISHATIQIECAGCASTHLYCALGATDRDHVHRHENAADHVESESERAVAGSTA